MIEERIATFLTPLRAERAEKWNEYTNTGKMTFHACRFHEAEKMFTLAVAEAQKSRPEDIRLVISLYNLAFVCDAQDRGAEAGPLYERASSLLGALLEDLLGRKQPDGTVDITDFIALYYGEGKCVFLDRVQDRATEIRQEAANYLRVLADLHLLLGEFMEAEFVLKRALEIREKVLGLEHFDVAATLRRLAWLNHRQGKYDLAEPFYLRALEIDRKEFGENHPQVADDLDRLAKMYYEQTKFADAEALYERSLEIRTNVSEPEVCAVAVSMFRLAQTYCAQHRYTQAEPLYKRLLHVTEGVPKPDHGLIAAALSQYAALLHETGRDLEAKKTALRACAIRDRLQKDDE